MDEKKHILIERIFNFLCVPFVIVAVFFSGGTLEFSELLLLGWNKFNELIAPKHL